jgi:tetratricopeptide (TPR) repeat protein
MGSSWVGTALLVAALLVCPVLLSSPDIFQHLLVPLAWLGDSDYFLIYPLVMGGLLLAASAWMRRWEAKRKLRGQMSIAFQLHNFQSVLELCKSVPVAVAKDPWLRYHMAFARAICGDRTTAIAEFEELSRDAPRLPMSGMTLSVLLLDRDQPERSLAVARQVAMRLPRDAAAQVLIACSLRRLGRLDEAQAASDRALALDPRSGVAHAVAAAIKLDGGIFSRAQQLIDTAIEVAPGEIYVLLIKAEMALKTQADGARAAVEEAIAAVRANPLAFYEVEVMRLSRLLAESDSATSDDELVLTAGLA